MPLANVILSEIAEAGYAVRVMPANNFSDETVVKAVDLATGRVWRGAGPSLIDAAEDLARQLNEHNAGIAPDAMTQPRSQLPHHSAFEKDSISIVIVLTLVAVIFIVDLFATGINLGALYLVPLCVAFRRRMDADWFAPLAVLIMLLIFATQILTGSFAGTLLQEPAGILNRCFAVFAIAGSAMVMKLVRAEKTAGQISNSRGTFVEYLATRKQWIGWSVAVYIAAIFIGDIMTPVSANLPIFYVLPLALVAATLRRAWLWSLVALLSTLTLWGYVESPRAGIIPAEVALVLVNRMVTCAGLALVALLFFYRKSGPSTGQTGGMVAS